jgi:hypothetical protein
MDTTTTHDLDREVSLFDEPCPEDCGGTVDDCEPDCTCADCANERALDNDAAAYADAWDD